ncbi:glycosyltransferase [Bacillus sp. CECT 9360]|uniref:glycosyltransferase family 2 protein n=1 Tax=Bacillus sp. CECT 9360 TaxID=2845821 RepID=UPI001E50BD25|nr:glycosyltransferase [Bacillus sp. CECT 9360]CAH0344250.1 Undecaprenyl-phosphate 4-deoxy-4-formamido-L-arabinose transferase [Bacillus sp. CECT 9360]
MSKVVEDLSAAQMQEITTEKKFSMKEKTFVITLFSLTVAALFYVNWSASDKWNLTIGLYGSVMIAYLLGKMILSFKYKTVDLDPPDLKVSVVIPSYNEEPEAVLGTIKSILKQDYPVHEIFVIDDGSKDISAYNASLKLKETLTANMTAIEGVEPSKLPELIVHRLPKNQGKRHAQIWAFERATGDVFVTVDSDCTVFSNAIRELLKPFNDSEVAATTGHVNIRNRTDNLLTRLIDMRYDNAFRVERAAHSVTGNVLVCSGPLSAYRRNVVMSNLEHYGTQTFLGQQVQLGDDRCLTNYAIREGKTLYQSTARCITDAPTSLYTLLKQQSRWNKSFFRESLVALKIGLKKPNVLVWVMLELFLWLAFGVSLVLAIYLMSTTMGWIMLIYYLAYVTISAYARNVFYAYKKPFTFLLAPVYGILFLILLCPLRFWALLTLRSTSWGTRG